MTLAALIIVPAAGAAFAYATSVYVGSGRTRDEGGRARVRRQARWTALATAAALLLSGLFIGRRPDDGLPRMERSAPAPFGNR